MEMGVDPKFDSPWEWSLENSIISLIDGDPHVGCPSTMEFRELRWRSHRRSISIIDRSLSPLEILYGISIVILDDDDS
jgi:hypothetical protein